MKKIAHIEGGRVIGCIISATGQVPDWAADMPEWQAETEVGAGWNGVSITPATAPGPKERKSALANAARQQRRELLAQSDWTQLPDAPVDQTAWADYRRALRDMPKQKGFPDNIVWPTAPF